MHHTSRALPGLARLAVLVGAAALVATPVAADAATHTTHRSAAHAAQGAGPRSAVTWNGWRGVRLGDTTRSAHRRLGGVLERGSNDPGACGDILQTHTGFLDAKVGPHAHRVSDISVESVVSYPLGVHDTMRASRITQRLEAHGFAVRSRNVDQTSAGDVVVENTSVGPHGHTLYFLSDPDTSEVYRMGLALNRHVATELMEITGC
jgi:hypothetical protein